MRVCYLALFILSFSYGASAQTQNQKDSMAVINVYKTLLALSKTGEHGKAASLLIYQGTDKARDYKSFLNYQVREERDEADETCIRLKHHILDAEKVVIEKFELDDDQELGLFYILKVRVTEGKSKRVGTLEFKKVKGKLGMLAEPDFDMVF